MAVDRQPAYGLPPPPWAYGVHALHSPGLRLESLVVEPGNGTGGIAGQPGWAGVPGANGAGGKPGRCDQTIGGAGGASGSTGFGDVGLAGLVSGGAGGPSHALYASGGALKVENTDLLTAGGGLGGLGGHASNDGPNGSSAKTVNG